MLNKKIRHPFRSFALTAYFLLSALFLQAQNVKTAIDKKDILIGQHINYRIQFTLPNSGFQVEFNLPDSIPHFDLIDKIKSDSTDAQGNYLVIQRLQLTSFDSGQWHIPSFAVQLRNGTSSYTVNTDSILVNVGYSPADSTGELRDIKPVMDVFIFDYFWIYLGAAVLAALIIALLLYRYFKNKPKKEKTIFASPISPYDEALQALKQLQLYDLSRPDDIRTYHIKLSEVFRQYYSRKQRQNLLNRTTGELLLRLKENGSDIGVITSLAEALRSSDAVKFAKYLPPISESNQSMEQVRSAIEQIEKNPIINQLKQAFAF